MRWARVLFNGSLAPAASPPSTARAHSLPGIDFPDTAHDRRSRESGGTLH